MWGYKGIIPKGFCPPLSAPARVGRRKPGVEKESQGGGGRVGLNREKVWERPL